MEEIFIALLSNPVVRSFIEGICVKVIVEIFRRRALDPDWQKKSDEVFDRYASAETEEEKTNALLAMQNLISTPVAR